MEKQKPEDIDPTEESLTEELASVLVELDDKLDNLLVLVRIAVLAIIVTCAGLVIADLLGRMLK